MRGYGRTKKYEHKKTYVIEIPVPCSPYHVRLIQYYGIKEPVAPLFLRLELVQRFHKHGILTMAFIAFLNSNIRWVDLVRYKHRVIDR